MCPPLEMLPDSMVDSRLAHYGIVVNFSCVEGFEMVDKNVSVLIECLDGGVWSRNISQCFRESGWLIDVIN